VFGQDSTPPSWSSAHVVTRVLFVTVSVALFLGAVVLGIHGRDRANEKLLHEQEGRHLVELQATGISRELGSVYSDLLFLAQQARLGELSTRPGPAREELKRQFRIFSEEKRIYDQVRYLDVSGMEIVRVDRRGGHAVAVPESELQDKSKRYYFGEASALGPGQVYVSPFDLNVERGQIEVPHKPVIRFSTSCFDEDGSHRGVVVLNYLGARLIDDFSELAANANGSSMLLNGEGYWLRGPTPEDEWGFMLGTERSFSSSYPQAWQRIANAPRGQFLAADGLYTFCALPLSSAASGAGRSQSLLLVSRLARSELYARADQLLTRLLVGWCMVLTLATVSAWVLIHAAGVRRHQAELVRLSEDRLRLLSKRLINAQEEERARLARDLHDDLGQLATTATLQLQMALQFEGDERTRRTKEAIESVEIMLQRAREMASWLRPPMLDDLGLKDAVQSYLSEFEGRSGLEVRTELRLEREEFPTEVSENVYRILQEALNNAVKYAGVNQVLVKLSSSESELALVVRDEGVGFRLEDSGSKALGILGMRERVDLLGGSFEIITAPGEGTEIRVDLPLPVRT
jgi:signal transduction histidine kinase